MTSSGQVAGFKYLTLAWHWPKLVAVLSSKVSPFDNPSCSWDSLTNSSGGIRGIVELETLFQIEKEMKNNELRIPLRAFFDLVVGTRCCISPFIA